MGDDRAPLIPLLLDMKTRGKSALLRTCRRAVTRPVNSVSVGSCPVRTPYLRVLTLVYHSSRPYAVHRVALTKRPGHLSLSIE